MSIREWSLLPLVMGKKGRNIWFFLVLLFSNLLAAVLEGVSFAFISLAFSHLGNGAVNESILFQSLNFVTSFLRVIQPSFIVLLALAIASQILRSTFSFIGTYFTSLLSLRIQTDAQSAIYHQIFMLNFSSFNRYKIGDLVEHLKTPTTIVSPLMVNFNIFLVSVFLSLISIVGMFFISFKLTCVVFSFYFVMFFLHKFMLNKIAHYSKEFSSQMIDSSEAAIQSLEGIRLIHTFSRQQFILSRNRGILDRIANTCRKLYFWNNSISSIFEVAAISLVGAILYFSKFLVEGENFLPLFLTFILLTYRLSSRILISLSSIGAVMVHFGNFLRLTEILSKKGKSYVRVGGKKIDVFSNEIRFADVSKKYDGGNRDAVADLSFRIPKGRTTALVGSSGSGKTTILDLLIGLYEPDRGQIFIDNESLSNIDLAIWRDSLGVVSQDVFLFNDSIEENIRFGCNNATHEEIVEAATMAGAHDFISQFPCGYKTLIGDRGYKLSGGERQRLSLARALLKNPQILIMDEATSSLDSYSEQIIQEAIEKFSRDRTIVVVAHRLSTVCSADQILVIDRGKLVEKGTHDDLIQLRGKYRAFWDIQSRSGVGVVISQV